MSARHCALALLLWSAGSTVFAAGASRKAAPTVGDLGARTVEIRKDGAVPASAGKAMENYQRFLELQNGDPQLRAEAMRRLGDLNLEGGELERMASEVTLLDRQGAEAIRLYTTLLQAYPDYPRNDQVLYQLARAYETTAQPEQALATLTRIVQRYPASREIGEVQFRRGELLFSAKRYPQAQTAYEAVIGRGATGSSFYEQSLYKHGWSLFKLSLNEPSLASFARVLDQKLVDSGRESTRSFESLTRADRELAEDTLRVMSIAFSYLDGAASVDSFFAGRRDAPYDWLVYSRLGDLYVEKQRYQDAAATYRAFVAKDPVDEHAPGLSMQAIKAYEKGGFAQLVVEGKTEFASSYGLKSAFWNGRQRADYPQIIAELKTNLRELAQHYHGTAQKSKQLADYGLAARWYRDYLGSFPDDPAAADTNYLLAESLFESRQYAEAVDEYEHTAYGYPRGAKSATSAYAALVAYQKQEELLPVATRAVWHARSVDSGLKFADNFPEHPESAGVQVRGAQDLYAAADLPRAMQTAEKLLARNPPVDRPRQRIAYTLIGQSQFDLKAFELAESAFIKALGVADAGAPERADLNERLAASVYKQGEAKRLAGDASGAAEDFLRVARVAPASKVVATSEYDAAAELVNSKQWERAISVLEGYRRNYPNTEYGKDITRKLAVAYLESGRSAQAAGEFERIAGTPGEDPTVLREALQQAADLHEKSGNTVRTVAMLEQLVQKYPSPAAEAIESRNRLAMLSAKSGNAARQTYWQNEIVKADAVAGAGRTDRTRYLAADARLALATPARDAFRAIAITAPLKTTLAAKRKSLDVALKNYQAVAAYDVAETTTAATFEMADLYRLLARDLLKSERPKGLNAEEREQYDALLEEQAYPFEEQAIEIHELNAARAPQGIYDTSVQKSFAALAELKPGRYGKSERSEERYGDVSVQAGAVARRAGKLDDALLELRTATTLDAANVEAFNELGITLRQQGKFAEARAAYEQALAAKPEFAPAWRNLAVLHDLYLGDPAAALPAMERYRELTGEERPVTGWIADLRQRAGVPAPAAAPAIAPAAAPGAAPGAAPEVAGTTGGT